ncbi:MAG: hypothetical protein WA324_15725 [Bryobacteraceae bacterium]
MAAGLAVGIGALTPTACVLAILFAGSRPRWWEISTWPLSFLIVSVLAAIAILGPGAYSIDARLFGRRKLTIGRPTD